MSIDFRTAILTMAEEMPEARVSTIVRLALAVENVLPPNLDDTDALARWARQQPAVAAEVTAGERIRAIKELRGASGASLKQAKDAIDALLVIR